MATRFANRFNRRQFLHVVAGGAIVSAVPCRTFAQSSPTKTCVYKKVGACQIKADVYQAAAAGRKPAVVWIHGGALIQGSRTGIDGRFHPEVLKQGYVVVSIDYRLAPETKLPEIIEDVQDAWRWVRGEGGRQLGIDPDRIAVAGGSAGGYLTLMTGFCLNPHPRALISYYGYGDITTPWYSEPDAFYRRQPLVSKEEAYRCVGDHVLCEPSASHQRGKFYLYCRQQGIWPNEVSGHDPHTESKWFDAYCPIRNVTPEYPPTFLIHGTKDTDVPYAESENMAAKLAKVGVQHKFITVTGAGHGLSGAKSQTRAEIAQLAVEFIRDRMT